MPRCNFNKVVKQSHFGIGVLLKFSAIFRTSFSKNIYGGLLLCVLLTLLSLHYCDWVSIGGFLFQICLPGLRASCCILCYFLSDLQFPVAMFCFHLFIKTALLH